MPWLVAAAVAGVLGAAAAVVWFGPALAVDRVRVAGATLVTDAEVRAAAAVRRGTPLVRVDTGAVHRRVAALPPVRAVRVHRELPSTVVIEVTERTPAAVVARGDGLWLIDAAGVAYTPALDRRADLVLLRLAAPAPGDPTTRAALTVLAALTPPLRERMAALAADAPARIRLELADGRVIIWGDARDNAAKVQVAVLMLGKPGQVIDVSAPDLVTVR
jgi:cell division protein FtsQ